MAAEREDPRLLSSHEHNQVTNIILHIPERPEDGQNKPHTHTKRLREAATLNKVKKKKKTLRCNLGDKWIAGAMVGEGAVLAERRGEREEGEREETERERDGETEGRRRERRQREEAEREREGRRRERGEREGETE